MGDIMQILNRDGKTTKVWEEMEAEVKKRQAYRSLSWIALPIGEARVEAGGGERFIKFVFLGPESSLGTRGYSGPIQDYFGFAAENVKPKRTTTSPHLSDLITFGRLSQGEPKEWLDPKLRPEVFTGKVKFAVLVGSFKMPIAVMEIGKVAWTDEQRWDRGNPADLFRGLNGSIFQER